MKKIGHNDSLPVVSFEFNLAKITDPMSCAERLKFLHLIKIINFLLEFIALAHAVQCASTMAKNGSKNPVKILRGGYEDFSAMYPFLRTQQVIYMPQVKKQFIVFDYA